MHPWLDKAAGNVPYIMTHCTIAILGHHGRSPPLCRARDRWESEGYMYSRPMDQSIWRGFPGRARGSGRRELLFNLHGGDKVYCMCAPRMVFFSYTFSPFCSASNRFEVDFGEVNRMTPNDIEHCKAQYTPYMCLFSVRLALRATVSCWRPLWNQCTQRSKMTLSTARSKLHVFLLSQFYFCCIYK